MVFGGAWGPNRWTRVARPIEADALRRMRVVEAAQPVPGAVAAWRRERAAAQAAGLLPPGVGQLSPLGLSTFIDDSNGAALNYPVVVPPELAHIEVSPAALVLAGGAPAHTASFAAVCTRCVVAALREVGLEESPGKTMCGDGVVALGLQLWRAHDRVCCPALKQAVVVRDCGEMLARLQAGEPIPTAGLETLTGRCCNLSQIYPELAEFLGAGYRAARPTRKLRGGGRVRPRAVRLQAGGPRQAELTAFMEVARGLVAANEGVPLAARVVFPSLGAHGVLTSVTDASGDDGVGGYAFHPAHPNTVWVVSEEWPPAIKAALKAAAERRVGAGASRVGPAARLAMPAAELFGILAVPAAVAASEQAPLLEAVVAIGDCGPAARAISRATSKAPQMRALLRWARRWAPQWLGVAVPREANLDADILSHPEEAWRVIEAAERAGLRVVRCPVPPELWAELEAACWRAMGSLAYLEDDEA
jgi:hypothetical protein